MRDVTERMESVTAGLSELVGTDVKKITSAVDRALSQRSAVGMENPYGDGRASERIVDILLNAGSAE
jgi:UDP-N-acetylglucosamine 2-epimerase (non-hydrolysing)